MATEETSAETTETKENIVVRKAKQWGAALRDLVGTTRREQVGSGVAGVGTLGIFKNILAVFGIGEFDVTETGLAALVTILGLAVRTNPRNLFGMDPGELVDAPRIDFDLLTDDQVELVADELGVSVKIFQEAASLSRLDPEKLEENIKSKYGDLLDRANGRVKGGIQPKEKALLECIQYFARLSELIGEGKVIVKG